MSDLKETLKVQSESAAVSLQEAGFNVKNKILGLPPTKRFLVLGLLIGLIPALLVVRYGTEQILSLQYGRAVLSAHPSFDVAQDPIVGDMRVITNPTGIYSAFVEITNPNLDLAAPNITYTVAFANSSGETVNSSAGSFYLLPNEKKTLVIPRIESSETVVSGELELGDVKWQKKISVTDVQLKVSEPILYEETNPLTFVAEGSVINSSPYELGAVRLVFALFNNSNQVVGVSQRDEFRLTPFGRRAYKQLWPGLYRSDVSKVLVTAYTNTLDPQNIWTEIGAPTPTPDDRNSNEFDFLN